jgi:hypothetical protein
MGNGGLFQLKIYTASLCIKIPDLKFLLLGWLPFCYLVELGFVVIWHGKSFRSLAKLPLLMSVSLSLPVLTRHQWTIVPQKMNLFILDMKDR